MKSFFQSENKSSVPVSGWKKGVRLIKKIFTKSAEERVTDYGRLTYSSVDPNLTPAYNVISAPMPEIGAIQSDTSIAVAAPRTEASESSKQKNTDDSDDDSSSIESDSDDDISQKYLQASITHEDQIIESSILFLGKINEISAAINNINTSRYTINPLVEINQAISQVYKQHNDLIKTNHQCRKAWINLVSQYQSKHAALLQMLMEIKAPLDQQSSTIIKKLNEKILPMACVCQNLVTAIPLDSKGCEQIAIFLEVLLSTMGNAGARGKMSPDMAAIQAIIQGNDVKNQQDLSAVLQTILEKIIFICTNGNLKIGTVKDDRITINGKVISLDRFSQVIENLLSLMADLSKQTKKAMTYDEANNLFETDTDLFNKIVEVEHFTFASRNVFINYRFIELLYDSIINFQDKILAKHYRYNSDPYLARVALSAAWKLYQSISTDNFQRDLESIPTNEIITKRILQTGADLSKLKISASKREERLVVAILSSDSEEVKKWIAEEKSAKPDFYLKIDQAKKLALDTLSYIESNISHLLDKIKENSCTDEYINNMMDFLCKQKIISNNTLALLRELTPEDRLQYFIWILNEKKLQAESIYRFLLIPLLMHNAYIEVEVSGKRISIATDEITNLAYLAGGQFGVVYRAEYIGKNPDFLSMFPGGIVVFKELRAKDADSLKEFEHERAIYVALSEASKKNPGLNCAPTAKAEIVFSQNGKEVKTKILICQYIVGQRKYDGHVKSSPSSLDGTNIATIIRNKGKTEQFLILCSIAIGIINAELILVDTGVLHLDAALRNILLKLNADGTYTPYLTDFGLSRVLDPVALENGRRFTDRAEKNDKLPIYAMSSQRLVGHGGRVEESAGPYEVRLLLTEFVGCILALPRNLYLGIDRLHKDKAMVASIDMNALANHYLTQYRNRRDFDAIDKENIERYFANIMTILNYKDLPEQAGLPEIHHVLIKFYQALAPYLVNQYVSIKQEAEKLKEMAYGMLDYSMTSVFSEYAEHKNIDELMTCFAHIRNIILTLLRCKDIQLADQWKSVLGQIDSLEKIYKEFGENAASLEKNYQVIESVIHKFEKEFLESKAKPTLTQQPDRATESALPSSMAPAANPGTFFKEGKMEQIMTEPQRAVFKRQ